MQKKSSEYKYAFWHEKDKTWISYTIVDDRFYFTGIHPTEELPFIRVPRSNNKFYSSMRKISQEVREQLEQEPNVCARKDEFCAGRITWEHTLIYAGRQIDEAWAIIKLCEYHHAVDNFQDGGDLNKEINVSIALNRATDEELQKYSKAVNYINMRANLNQKYGEGK